ncbi:uroporphyrinogen decarboxylase family protein [Clostridium grantii]|uniref:Uroporphyrinogen decarboxylase (URO-D) n=1 Tax=Clostridium grantii DSM 8605 TaxID=1121316 RepID=A0A1M5U375_9CLOT|nr:uroporphyrinogen decarboxylase family protein [Clostridium grantii]SHH57123.1 Uroporphyrinogen decarboxylase (URO-D) [Clostridium grantii DSM 8605]
MSYKDGWAALNLEMTDRVPRTEYSASEHWDLVKKVTGISVDTNSTKEERIKASSAFRKVWNYDFNWSVLFHTQIFDGFKTDMGHAEYATGGEDYSNQVSCPFNSPEEVLKFDFYEKYGKKDRSELVKQLNDHYKANCEKNPDGINMTGIYSTAVSGLLEVFGWDMMLMAMGTDMDSFGQVMNRYGKWIMQYFEALAECDSKVIMVHDDIVWTSGPFVHPSWYREYIFPNYKKFFAPLLEAGKKIIYTSDGNYNEFIDDVANCGVHGFVMEPTTDMKYIAEKYGKTHSFIGNADTKILLSGTKEEIYNEVKRCMDIGKKYPGFFMAVGNHIPSNTPIENALYYNEVYEKLSKR